MKSIFNSRIPSLIRKDEVNLFGLMAELFNTSHSKSTFVKKVHGRIGFVDYNSTILGRIKTVEIADLQLITCNRKTNEIRICFIQAKYRRGNFSRFLTLNANLFQWELLKDKPDIIDTYHNGFPTNILNFSTYKSITSFGIFYEDKSGEIDFLYTLPKHISKRNNNEYQTMNFYGSCYCPNIHCAKGIMSNETISTCSMDIFEKEVLACKIGAPVVGNIKIYLAGLLQAIRSNNSNEIHETLDEFNSRLGDVGDNISLEVNYPNTILLLTDGNEQ